MRRRMEMMVEKKRVMTQIMERKTSVMNVKSAKNVKIEEQMTTFDQSLHYQLVQEDWQ